MHMADALLSPGVGTCMYAASACAMGYAAVKLKKDERFDEKALPVMAVTGALVFAGQMINFTIPGTGSSGHIGGGILLASMLGPKAGLLTIAAVLLIQCLFFADGGLLALGCNIFNMGVIPCLIVYPLVFVPLAERYGRKGITSGSILAVVLGLQLGAFSVVLETIASGAVEIPFETFVLLMQPIHLAIGLVEGIVTALVLSYVYRVRPETLDTYDGAENEKSMSGGKLAALIGIAAIILGAFVSLYASGYPDGLEWALEKAGAGEPSGGIYEVISRIQEKTSILPDYEHTSISGLVGGILVVIAAFLTGLVITMKKKKDRND